MTTRLDLLRGVAAVADDLGAITAPADARRLLQSICRAARLALDAASVSVARLEGGTLVYEAADGAGAVGIVGTHLATSRGIAGYVARTGHALIIEQVAQDPRFARDVAERVGYVPQSLLAAPIVADRGDVVGVLSILDRTRQGSDTLELATAFADQAALVVPHIDAAVRLAPALFSAVAEALADDHRDLAAALRRQAARLPDDTADLAALLVELRKLAPDARASAVRVLEEFVKVAATTRRRR
jgi:GAF domain-containing protein